MGLLPQIEAPSKTLAPGLTLFHARANAGILKAALAIVETASPRSMTTPWGKAMSTKSTNCGTLGWISDQKGYRYSKIDPLTGHPWPDMPACFFSLASICATEAGFPDFRADSCLINVYDPGTKMGAHRDQDERDFSQPIVSVSLGASAIFRWGGLRRADPSRKILLEDGDVLVFGGPARLCFHGIDRILPDPSPVLGTRRINLTFRCVN